MRAQHRRDCLLCQMNACAVVATAIGGGQQPAGDPCIDHVQQVAGDGLEGLGEQRGGIAMQQLVQRRHCCPRVHEHAAVHAERRARDLHRAAGKAARPIRAVTAPTTPSRPMVAASAAWPPGIMTPGEITAPAGNQADIVVWPASNRVAPVLRCLMCKFGTSLLKLSSGRAASNRFARRSCIIRTAGRTTTADWRQSAMPGPGIKAHGTASCTSYTCNNRWIVV